MNAQFIFEQAHQTFHCNGDWTIFCLDDVESCLQTSELPRSQHIVVRAEKLTGLDSAGALRLTDLVERLLKRGNQVEYQAFNEQQTRLLSLIHSKREIIHSHFKKPHTNGLLYEIGKETVLKLQQLVGFVGLIGDLADKLFLACRQWRRFRLASIVANIEASGLRALPILALLSFLIGVVLAYQMGLQLETYGASSFIAYLSGMAIFREFAPLITAIIVAGRTSSAITAQIGSMKINEEIDALYTMGLSPTELLVVPKTLALLLVFPLLIFWADFFSTLGAMMMSKFMLHVGYRDFLLRLQESVGMKQLVLGLCKAPTFAMLISLVGCFQGFLVEPNADSVGTQTTKSVVQALFLIIVTDAAYSVIYSWLNL